MLKKMTGWFSRYYKLPTYSTRYVHPCHAVLQFWANSCVLSREDIKFYTPIFVLEPCHFHCLLMWYVVIVQYSIHLSSFIITRDIFSLRHCRQMSRTYDVEEAYEKMAAKYIIYDLHAILRKISKTGANRCHFYGHNTPSSTSVSIF